MDSYSQENENYIAGLHKDVSGFIERRKNEKNSAMIEIQKQ